MRNMRMFTCGGIVGTVFVAGLLSALGYVLVEWVRLAVAPVVIGCAAVFGVVLFIFWLEGNRNVRS